MRRLSGFLMVFALLAALVPSTALAGKVVPTIQRVDVSGSSGYTAPNCELGFWVAFTGTPYEIRYTPVVGGVEETPWTVAVPRKSSSVGGSHMYTDLATRVYTWKVELLDRKGNTLDQATTTAERWTIATLCPSAGIQAGFPTQGVPTPFQSVCTGAGGTYLASSVIAGIGKTVAPYCDLPDGSAVASLADMCWGMGRIGSIYETTWEMGCSEYIPRPHPDA
jgi:hypothetical protein